MKITYTGRQVELAPAQLKKIEARAAKVGKLLDGRCLEQLAAERPDRQIDADGRSKLGRPRPARDRV